MQCQNNDPLIISFNLSQLGFTFLTRNLGLVLVDSDSGFKKIIVIYHQENEIT